MQLNAAMTSRSVSGEGVNTYQFGSIFSGHDQLVNKSTIYVTPKNELGETITISEDDAK